MKLAGIAVLAGGIGVAALYVRDARIRAAGESDLSTYHETAAIKLDSGQPIQLRITRCDLGATSRQLILKVHGEAVNLGHSEAPRHRYRFFVRDGRGRLYADVGPLEDPGTDTFALRAGGRRQLVLKYLLEPDALLSSLDLAGGADTNRLVRLKSADPPDWKLGDGAWRAFHGPRW